MKCPDCRLDNPDTAQRCGCGYDFEKEGVNPNVPSHKTPTLGAGQNTIHYHHTPQKWGSASVHMAYVRVVNVNVKRLLSVRSLFM